MMKFVGVSEKSQLRSRLTSLSYTEYSFSMWTGLRLLASRRVRTVVNVSSRSVRDVYWRRVTMGLSVLSYGL